MNDAVIYSYSHGLMLLLYVWALYEIKDRIRAATACRKALVQGALSRFMAARLLPILWMGGF